MGEFTHFNKEGNAVMVDAVSYTHLDVYKRQEFTMSSIIWTEQRMFQKIIRKYPLSA